jgi:hypothetical protein
VNVRRPFALEQPEASLMLLMTSWSTASCRAGTH